MLIHYCRTVSNLCLLTSITLDTLIDGWYGNVLSIGVSVGYACMFYRYIYCKTLKTFIKILILDSDYYCHSREST